jgi:hypothetical protein
MLLAKKDTLTKETQSENPCIIQSRREGAWSVVLLAVDENDKRD